MADQQFAAFGGDTIYAYQRTLNGNIVGYIQNLSDGTLFGSADAEVQLILKLTEDFRLQPPVIQFDQKTKDIVATSSVRGYRSPHQPAPERLIRYTLPVTGEVELLKLAPRSRALLGMRGAPILFLLQGGVDGAVAFYIEDHGNSDAIVQAASQVLENLRVNSEQLQAELDGYNGSVSSVVRNALAEERQRRELGRERTDDLLNRLP